MVVHERYESMNISLSSAQQHREMIEFCVFWEMQMTVANVFLFSFGIERWCYMVSLSRLWDR